MVSHRHPHPRARRTAVVVVLSAATTAAAALAAGPVRAEPDPATARGAAHEVDRLVAEAERAIDRYNGTAERVETLRADVERRQDRVARGQQTVNQHRRALGRAAAAHYRNGPLGPALALMLADSPDTYLERAGVLDRLGDRRAGELRRLLAAQRVLDQRRQEATERLERLAAEEDRLGRQKRDVQRRLASARRQYQRLTEREREERLSKEAPAPAALPAAPAAASGRGGSAVAAARGVLGRPYGWGQAGPGAFDCSGLVQWAWARAGVALPRTSQQQAHAGKRVPLSQARPGDIVVYRADASHVGLYAGGGQVIHAPYPGAAVRYDPVGMMPVSGVVRP
ncbi:NlpC/P60 family protein [Streptomyces sp. DSM 44917]|uniref:NlpC/P60 family protein n=1 Tax=Streptomyces boetiae TaxID=3075541 RepID=A0ABU2LEB8_9ACTN|nr:NlpC/P60 family protein [Streptomyces sp. DSM 44917]MDT0309825.1 NlpC/P60 family protein [Streptomyces sp. DSM 44917]